MEISRIDPQLIAQSELFRDMDPAALGAVLAGAVTRSAVPGSALFQQGDEPAQLFLVVQGRFKMSVVTADGAQMALRVMEPGDLIGCAAVFRKIPYPATATALEQGVVLAWPGAQLDRLIKLHPQIAINALAIIGGRTEEMLQRIREVTTESAEKRIARALFRLSTQATMHAPDGKSVALALSRQDLAQLSGTSLFTVSRMISAWKRQGILELGRRRVEVRDPKKLKAIAEAAGHDAEARARRAERGKERHGARR
jgi:CRP-like cAMP-binding protein